MSVPGREATSLPMTDNHKGREDKPTLYLSSRLHYLTPEAGPDLECFKVYALSGPISHSSFS